jgi:O-antigen ligase
MMPALLEKKLSWIVAIGMATSMLMVSTFISIEPVNTPKALILIPLGIAAWFALAQIEFRPLATQSKVLLGGVVTFAILVLINISTSSAPLEQTLYGSFGRSTGAATYFSLVGILALVASFGSSKSIEKLSIAILVVGIVNLIYCGIDIIGPDLLNWNNQYGEILGTFGNPNFIGAFFGIFGSLLAAYLLQPGISTLQRILILITYAATLVETYFSKAYQGLVVFLFGTALAIYFWIRTNEKFKKFGYAYLIALSIGVIAGLLGLSNKGPLASLLSKSSISYRGVYWETGITIGTKHPFTGIGFDAFGDYYREFRPARALISPGPTVTTNTAHNVPIDLFAAGGFPLFLTYMILMSLGAIAVVQIIRKMKSFDALGIGLIVAWIGYQIQSLVSINQIGLAICGWVLTGALIGYSRILWHVEQNGSNPANKAVKNESTKSSVFLPVIGILVGLAIAIPPFAADAAWRTALNKGDGTAITKVAEQWPRDTYRITQIAIALEGSGLVDQSLNLARENVKFDPRSFDAWRVLSQVTKSTPEEKARSIEMMHKLDPLNTELK